MEVILMVHIRITCPWNPAEHEERALSATIGRAAEQGVRVKVIYEFGRDTGKYHFVRVGRVPKEVNARVVSMFHEELRRPQ